jgi:magnesium-protoporphyrin IX monomethyl ester (oxidative) cyclase
VPSIAIMKKVKELDPSVITIIGGSHCAGKMGAKVVSNYDWIDFAFSGECYEAFPEIITLINKYGKDIPKNEFPNGLLNSKVGEECLDKDIIRYGVAKKLDEIPNPNHDDYFFQLRTKSYGKLIEVEIPVESSRGCWWGRCRFCGLNNLDLNYRVKNAENVADEFENLYNKYKINKFHAVDNVFPKSFFSDLLPKLNKKNINWNILYEARPETTGEQVEMFAKARVLRLLVGIESLIDEAINLMNKGGSAIQRVRLLRDGIECNVKIHWNFLVDIPNEDDNWYLQLSEWLPLISHLMPPDIIGRIVITRFSEYYNKPEDFNLKLRPANFYKYVYNNDEKEIEDLCYFFDIEGEVPMTSYHRAFQKKKGLLTVKNAIEKWRDLWESGKVPCLKGYLNDRNIKILDTRPCSSEKNHEISGLQKDILLNLKFPMTFKALCHHFKSVIEFNNDDLIKNELDTLVSNKLVLQLGNRYLNLVVFENQ